MEYELSVSDDRRYINIRLYVPMTAKLSRTIAHDLADLSDETKIERFFFDLRGAVSELEVLSSYTMAYEDLEKIGPSRSHMSVFLTDVEDKSHDFMETLYRNAGFNVKQFKDKDTALAWLLG
jgi:hypothetical protein